MIFFDFIGVVTNKINHDQDRLVLIARGLPRLAQMAGLAMTGYEREYFIGKPDHSKLASIGCYKLTFIIH